MTTTLTATALRDLAAIRLDIQSTVNGPLTLTRTDTNGTAVVRVRAGQAITPGLLSVTDYEPAMTGLVTYQLVHDGTHTASASLDTPETRLAVAVSPQLGVNVPLVSNVTAEYRSNNSVHQVDRGPAVVITGPLGKRRGRLEITTLFYAEALAVVQLYTAGDVVLLRQPDHPGLDLYHVLDGGGAVRVDLAPNRDAWITSVDYAEVPRPADALLGDIGWNFAQLRDTYPSFAAVRQAFPTFSSLTIGVPTA